MPFLQGALPVLVRVKAGSPLGIPELPVRLLSVTGIPVAGMLAAGMSPVTFVMADLSILTFPLNGTAAAWRPADGDMGADGVYHIILSPAKAATLFTRAKSGQFQYFITPL